MYNCFYIIMQTINETLCIVKGIRVLGIGFKIIHKSNKVVYVLIDRTSLPNLEQTTE